MGIIKDLAGQKFGKLTVLEISGRASDRRIIWKCQCDCGNVSNVRGSKLTGGHTKSCGCLQLVSNYRHGLTGTRAAKRVYEERRREREKRLDSEWTVEMSETLLDRFPFCAICLSTDNLCIDHVQPLSKGHGLKPGNAVTLCRSCNSRKKDKLMESLDLLTRRRVEVMAMAFQIIWNQIGSS